MLLIEEWQKMKLRIKWWCCNVGGLNYTKAIYWIIDDKIGVWKSWLKYQPIVEENSLFFIKSCHLEFILTEIFDDYISLDLEKIQNHGILSYISYKKTFKVFAIKVIFLHKYNVSGYCAKSKWLTIKV